jgi:hypothetical protein
MLLAIAVLEPSRTITTSSIVPFKHGQYPTMKCTQSSVGAAVGGTVGMNVGFTVGVTDGETVG